MTQSKNLTLSLFQLAFIRFICFCILKMFLKKFKIFYVNIFLMFLDHFDVLMSKIIFKK